MADRPGTMIYFEILPVLEELTDEQAGQLFRGAMHYAKDGDAPHYKDPMIRVVWAMMKDGLDRDAEQYATVCAKNAYRAYCRWEKEKGHEPMPYDEWYTTAYKRIPTHTNDANPTTTQPNPTQLQPNYNPTPTQLQQERKGVQGETQTGAILHEIPQPYRPPDAGEWERLKAEQTAKLREVKLE